MAEEEPPMEEDQDEEFPGLGDEEYPGFPAWEVPEECPDISKHFSIMTDVLKERPELYSKLRGQTTQLGTTLGKCIKTGIDNKGHPMIKTVGMVAGDEECYETFNELFDPVISTRHEGYATDAKHPTNLDCAQLSTTKCDPSGKYILSAQVRTARSLRGLRLPPAMSQDERREAERVGVKALLQLKEPLKGDYFPLAGSTSYPPKPSGMSPEEADELQKDRLLFEAPDSTLLLCSGIGRQWPDARGVFVNASKSFVVWMNEEEHIRAISMKKGDAVQEAFTQVVSALDNIETSLKESPQRYEFMHNDHLGFVTSCPSNLGTALRVSMIIHTPLLAKEVGWRDWCMAQRLQIRSACSTDGQWLSGLFEVSNRDRLGMSEVDLCNHIIYCVSSMVAMEQKLEAGETDLPELLVVDGRAPMPPSQEVPPAPAAAPAVDAPAVEAPPAETPAAKADWQLGDIKDKARSCLEQGLASGNLEKLMCTELSYAAEELAAKVETEKAMEAKTSAIITDTTELKELAKECLESGLASGALEKAVVQEKEAAASNSLQAKKDCKTVTRMAFEKGIDSGELVKLLGAIPQPAAAAPAKLEVTPESVAQKALRVLEESAEDGQLAQMLQEPKKAVPQEISTGESTDDLKDKARETLSKALDTGDLEKYIIQKADGAKDSIGLAKQLLEEALDDGTLEKMMSGTAVELPPLAAAEVEIDEEAVRQKVSNCIMAGLQNGKLDDFFTELATSPRNAENTDGYGNTAGVKEQAATALLSGLDTGALETHLLKGAANSEPKPAPAKDVKQNAKLCLEKGFDTGALKQLLESQSQTPPVAAEPVAAAEAKDADLVSGTKDKALKCLEEALDSGMLLGLLVNDDQDQDSSMDDLKSKFKECLDNGLDSGLLEEAMLPVEAATPKDKARSCLEEAVQSGKLEEYFAETFAASSPAVTPAPAASGTAVADEVNPLEDVKLMARRALEEGLSSGALEDDLRKCMPSPPPPPLEEERKLSPEEMARQALEQGLASGSLEEDLKKYMPAASPPPVADEPVVRAPDAPKPEGKSRPGPKPKAKPAEEPAPMRSSEEEIKDKAKKAFEQGMESGDLEKCFAELRSPTPGQMDPAPSTETQAPDVALISSGREFTKEFQDELVKASPSQADAEAAKPEAPPPVAPNPPAPSSPAPPLPPADAEDKKPKKASKKKKDDAGYEGEEDSSDSEDEKIEKKKKKKKQDKKSSNNAVAVIPQMPANPIVADPTPQYSLLKLISDRDRTIGSLLAQIAEMERHFADRSSQCQSLEERINGARLDCKHLQLDVEFHQQKIEETNAKNVELEETQRRCMLELEDKHQKLRHASVDLSTTCSSAMSGATTVSSIMMTPGSDRGNSSPRRPLSNR
eukprot:gnl/MRDRNA2_/MRDRNA2_106075_c0_seq1.p1 gnl/MRDRNA2_/MRDRNA2_106075_c0~~gnl/MRDRNA2_/MRDRNA2_106075_c0_seq1.p1  ORF type:complete len:1378 (-),score=437.65 gnl/MRDRNA2_/MRDRNA2_106075_c0_seq1:61-4194(-)